MPKLAWVLLPLAAAAGWLALCAWRGRLPTRQTMNVLFSLLLLGYVAGTAGLGIFWVANQQLPVFDWHYTFGYATVLVLLVHLGFNLRIVVQHLRRLVRREPAPLPRRPPAVLAGETGGTSRRPIIGLAGTTALAAAAGVGYLVGLRHGRTELQLAASGTAGPREASNAARVDAIGGATPTPHTTHAVQTPHAAAAASEAWAVVERFHAFSAHSRTRVLRHAASTDWGEAPAPFKRHPGAERLPLPQPTGAQTRRGADPFDLAALATALWHTAGVSERRGGIAFRTSPSSGALFATELYVLALDGLAGLPPGSWWHYDAEAHVLKRVPVGPAATDVPRAAPGGAASVAARAGLAAPASTSALDPLGPLDLPAPCHALVVASALFARSGHKYGDRTYRYVLADLGHALENLRQAAAAQGAQATLLPRFDEAALAAALALDERREGVLAVVAIAPPDATHPGRERNADSAGRASDERYVTAWRAGAVQGADASARLGLTEAMHAATSLRALPAPPLRADPNLPTVPTVPTLPAGLADAPARSSDSPARSSDARTRPSAAPAREARDAGLRPQAAGPPAAQPPAPATPTPPTPPAADAHTLPPGRILAAEPLSVIARRRSVRRFSTEPLSQQMLADVLHTMTTVSPLLLPAVRIDLLTPAVAGLPPAAWRVEAPSRPDAPGGASAAIRLHRRVTHGAALRQRARAAALDQDVIGDAAAVFVLSLDRGALQADPAGAARGYRHGFIEAGLVGERIYLAAGALGLGACAVGAFYDDEAAALVGLDPGQEWPVHFAALGVPGKAFAG